MRPGDRGEQGQGLPTLADGPGARRARSPPGGTCQGFRDLASGKHTKSYWTWPIEIVDFTIKIGDFPVRKLLVYQRVPPEKMERFHQKAGNPHEFIKNNDGTPWWI